MRTFFKNRFCNLAISASAVVCLCDPLLNAAFASPERLLSPKRENAADVNSLALLIEAEDTRTLNKRTLDLLKTPKRDLRKRAYIAIGRIGDKTAVKSLTEALATEKEADLRQLVVFAFGEIEDKSALPSLFSILESTRENTVMKGRAAEAIGKIASSKPTPSSKERSDSTRLLTAALTSFDHSTALTESQQFLISKTLVALLRIKDASSLDAVAKQLKSPSPEIRWQAANVLSRMKDGIAPYAGALNPLLSDSNPLVRAYAAKALAVAKDKASVNGLLILISDRDDRVKAAAISALGGIADQAAALPLMELGQSLLIEFRKADAKLGSIPDQQNLLLLIASSLGSIKDPKSLPFLHQLRTACRPYALCPEVEIAIAQFGDDAFFSKDSYLPFNHNEKWQSVSATAQGLAVLKSKRANEELLDMLKAHPDYRAESEVLNSLAAVKTPNLLPLLLEKLRAKDVILRSTAATLIGEHADSEATKISADEVRAELWKAFLAARQDQMNDARIALLEAATKLKKPFNKEVLTGQFRDADYIVRKKALELQRELEPNNSSLASIRIGPVGTNHDRNYWRRLAELSTSTENLTAILITPKGKIVVELFLHDSPMNVDNFASLARRGYYDGLTFMRVVPNFVIQGGDPRNDMNGGPGYQIRCEINEHSYKTGSVGMALSGKDTGGSQFFITHSPQPHLDGGYTLFGQVRSGMDVVNKIARGDKINHIEIVTTK